MATESHQICCRRRARAGSRCECDSSDDRLERKLKFSSIRGRHVHDVCTGMRGSLPGLLGKRGLSVDWMSLHMKRRQFEENRGNGVSWPTDKKIRKSLLVLALNISRNRLLKPLDMVVRKSVAACSGGPATKAVPHGSHAVLRVLSWALLMFSACQSV